MPFEKNASKVDRINRFGITVDLPLFNQPKEERKDLPGWIWSGTAMKADIYKSLKEKFNDDCMHYLEAIITLGGKATDHDVREYFGEPDKWTLAIISARRNDLKKIGVIACYGKKKTGPRGMPNYIWEVDFKQLYKILFIN